MSKALIWTDNGHSFDAGMISMAKLPEYLEQNVYRNPDDQNSGPVQYAHNIAGESLWPHIAARPKLLNATHAFFEGDREADPYG